MPFECSVVVGTAWQASQPSAARIAPVVTCAWCAPTATSVVAVSPFVAMGGAAFSSEPWQELQPSVTSSSPFTCRPPATSMAPAAVTVSGWQRLHSESAGCGAGGGFPWQVPHAVCPLPTSVQTGSVFVPPAARVAPWQ